MTKNHQRGRITLIHLLHMTSLIFLMCFAICDATVGIKYKVSNWKMCSPTENAFLTLRNIPVEVCLLQCKLRPRCKAVDFFRVRGQCDLFSTDVNTGTIYNQSPCIFIKSSDIILPTPIPCQHCSTAQVCDMELGVCVKRECDKLHVPSAEVKGNMLNIASTVRIVADPGYTLSNQSDKVVCQSDGTWKVIPVLLQLVETCEVGWYRNNHSCYLGSTTSRYFEDSKTHCSSLNAHLVYVETAAENDFMKQHVADIYSTSHWWLGITDEETEGVWKNVDTQETIHFFDWGPDEPNNNGPENCAVLSYDNTAWADVKCNTGRKALCEKSTTTQAVLPP